MFRGHDGEFKEWKRELDAYRLTPMLKTWYSPVLGLEIIRPFDAASVTTDPHAVLNDDGEVDIEQAALTLLVASTVELVDEDLDLGRQ